MKTHRRLTVAQPAFPGGAPVTASRGPCRALTWTPSQFPCPQVTKWNDRLMARSHLSSCEVSTKQGTAFQLGEARLLTCDLEDKNPGSQVGLEAFCGRHSRSGLFPPPPGRLCGSGSALLRAQRGKGVRVGSRSPDFHTFLRGKGLSKFKARPRKAESPPAPPAPPVPTLQQPLVAQQVLSPPLP